MKGVGGRTIDKVLRHDMNDVPLRRFDIVVFYVSIFNILGP